jgi:hypothetical protein
MSNCFSAIPIRDPFIGSFVQTDYILNYENIIFGVDKAYQLKLLEL